MVSGITTLQEVFGLVAESENKLFFRATFEVLADYKKTDLRDGKMSLTYIELLRQEQLLFTMKKFSPFYDEFKWQINNFIECGHLKEYSLDRSKNANEGINDNVPPLVLNMEDLGIGFLVCLFPLTLAVVAFICELSVPLMSALAFSMRERLTFLYLIRNVAMLQIIRI